jgi:hypothetical protein
MAENMSASLVTRSLDLVDSAAFIFRYYWKYGETVNENLSLLRRLAS